MTEVATTQTSPAPSGDIAPFSGGGLAALPQTGAVIQLQEWAAELAAAHQLGSALARSSFLPMSLRMKGKNNFKTIEELTNDAAAVILAGKSVGLDPMQSVQNIFPVHGQPSMYARTMGALVMAEGHETRRVSATNDAVTWAVRRKGAKDWQEFTWSIDRAKKAGFTSNAKYLSQPIEMLGAKALAEACRTVFPDVLLGMAYSVEDMELEDLGEVPASTAPDAPAAPVKAKATVKRRQQPAPDLPDVVNHAPTPEPDPEPEQAVMASNEQITHLQVALKAAGHTTNAAKAAAVQEQVGRTLAGFQDLTADEAEGLIGFFNSATPAAADDAASKADAEWLAGASA